MAIAIAFGMSLGLNKRVGGGSLPVALQNTSAQFILNTSGQSITAA